jgi:tripartite-type tricarboxylate transporter receptor subunit TctC
LKPSPIAPDLTPMAVAVPGYEFELWWGLLAPAGTPPEVVAKLNAAVNQILAKPESPPTSCAKAPLPRRCRRRSSALVIAEDVERWKKLAKQQNITAD